MTDYFKELFPSKFECSARQIITRGNILDNNPFVGIHSIISGRYVLYPSPNVYVDPLSLMLENRRKIFDNYSDVGRLFGVSSGVIMAFANGFMNNSRNYDIYGAAQPLESFAFNLGRQYLWQYFSVRFKERQL